MLAASAAAARVVQAHDRGPGANGGLAHAVGADHADTENTVLGAGVELLHQADKVEVAACLDLDVNADQADDVGARAPRAHRLGVGEAVGGEPLGDHTLGPVAAMLAVLAHACRASL